MTTYDIGDEALLVHLMGEDFDNPLKVKVTDTCPDSMLYSYIVTIPHCYIESTATSAGKWMVRDQQVYVREGWLIPAEYVIQELDTPFD